MSRHGTHRVDHDPHPGSTSVPNEGLRRALRAALPGPTVSPELADAVRELARTARADAIPPEKLVIALKEMLGPVPVPQQIHHRAHSTLSSRIVAIGIEEYFRAD